MKGSDYFSDETKINLRLAKLDIHGCIRVVFHYIIVLMKYDALPPSYLSPLTKEIISLVA